MVGAKKQKKCKSCGDMFQPFQPMQRICSPDCALTLVRDEKRKEVRRDTRKRKAALVSRGEHLKKAQAAFNKYIRLRDAGKPCISCGRPDDGAHQRHASHYRSRGAHPELAFDELNVHASCAQCNSMKSGNLIDYRIGLIRKIGQDAVDSLEGPHDPQRLSIEQINNIRAHYARLCREIEREN